VGIGEWNSSSADDDEQPHHRLHDTGRESRRHPAVPFVTSEEGRSNLVRIELYTRRTSSSITRSSTGQLHKIRRSHSLTFGGAIEKYTPQLVLSGSRALRLQLAGRLLHDAKTTRQPGRRHRRHAADSRLLFECRGRAGPAFQMLTCGTRARTQDVWKPRSNLTITGGCAWTWPASVNGDRQSPVDALTFRDGDGIQSSTTPEAADASPLWSPRVGVNWDVTGKSTQIRGGTASSPQADLRLDFESDWQHRMLTGTIDTRGATTKYPFNPSPDAYKPLRPVIRRRAPALP